MPTSSARQIRLRRAADRRRQRRLFVEPLEHRWLLNGQSLLFTGIDDSAVSPTNAGLTLAADLDTGRQMPLHAQVPFTGTGISGMAFTPSGELFGSTSAGPGSTSALVRIDPLTGKEISRVPIHAGGLISIADLAVRPQNDEVYGVRSADDGGGGAGQIYKIDVGSGLATLVGQPNSGVSVDGGLAFDSNGMLFYTTRSTLTGSPVLHTLDPDTAAVLSTVSLTGSQGFNSGLGYRADDGTLVGSGAPNGDIVRIDPTTGVRTVIPLDAPSRGIMGDVAFQPESPTLEHIHRASFENGTEGYTADNTGRATPGLWHYSLGRSADGLLNHSLTHAWYYGAFETITGGGRYPVTREHKGVLISPEIDLPDSGTTILSFSYLLETRPELTHDFVTVSIEHDGTVTEILSRQDGTLPQTGRDKWLTSTAGLSQFNGQTIRVHFTFDTGMGPPIDPEGWYVDDVQISNLFEPPGSIAWEKRDTSGNFVAVEGATFTVTPHPIPGDVGTFTVVDNGANDLDDTIGAILITAAVDVKYTVTETVPPLGYLLDPDPTRMAMPTTAVPDVSIGTPGQDDEEDFHNRLLGSIAWEKRDTTSGELVPVAGATFTVNPHPIPGGVGTFTVVDNGANDLDNTIGEILITAAVDVKYTVTETVPPLGYLLDPDPTRMAMPTTAVPDVSIGAAGQDDEEDFHNRLGSIAWEKRDDTSGELVPLGGATFIVSPHPIPGGAGTFTVVDNGANDLNATIGEILIHAAVDVKYTITETVPPPGYVVDPDPTRMAMPTTAVPDVSIGTAGQNDDEDFHNPLGSIAWEKRDDTSGELVPLEGATFIVSPHPIPGGVGTFTVVDNGANDLDNTIGEILIHAAVDVKYTITETVPPPGYVVDPDPMRMAMPTTAVPDVSIGTPGQDDEEDFHNMFTQPDTQTIQFITPMSVYRPDGLFARPPDSQLAIAGYVWHDETGDGVWNAASENGLNGVIVYVDLDESGTRDAGEPAIPTLFDGARDGAFWFTTSQFVGDPPDPITLRVDLPSGGPTFPATGAHQITIDAGDPTIGDFGQAAPPNFGVPTDFVDNPESGLATIIGYLWHDVDQDGQWDDEESGMAGWRFFLDVNNNGVFDPDALEPFAVTDAEGRYTFANIDRTAGTDGLGPGLYVLHRDRIGLSDGTFTVQVFPVGDAGGIAVDVSLATGTDEIVGVSGQAVEPNFGVFDYSPLIRPADAEADYLMSTFADRREQILTALEAWQTFVVTNTTGQAFEITQIDKDFDDSQIAEVRDFVNVFTSEPDGTLTPVELDNLGRLTNPILVPSEDGNNSQTFFVFYDPATRINDGVAAQYPDWSDGLTQSHTFARSDQLRVSTEFTGTSQPGPFFDVLLVGASTFDSDIFYDGFAEFSDLGRLDDVLLDAQWPIQKTSVQLVRIVGENLGGTFTLTFQGETTGPIAHDATNQQVEAALENLTNVTDVRVGDPLVGNGPHAWEVAFFTPGGEKLGLIELDSIDVTGTFDDQQSFVTLADRFDPTSDINARFPNGAEKLGGATWPIDGPPLREIGLGDFGPLNVEWLSARGPFLDLDPDNSSQTRGVDFSAEFTGTPVKIADSDASFANNDSQAISFQSLTVEIIDAQDGDTLQLDSAILPGGVTVSGNGTAKLELQGTASVGQYNDWLKEIEFAATDQSSRIVEIAVSATGSDSQFIRGNIDERQGNTAMARVKVVPAVNSGSLNASPLVGAESEIIAEPDTLEQMLGVIDGRAASDPVPAPVTAEPTRTVLPLVSAGLPAGPIAARSRTERATTTESSHPSTESAGAEATPRRSSQPVVLGLDVDSVAPSFATPPADAAPASVAVVEAAAWSWIGQLESAVEIDIAADSVAPPVTLPVASDSAAGPPIVVDASRSRTDTAGLDDDSTDMDAVDRLFAAIGSDGIAASDLM